MANVKFICPDCKKSVEFVSEHVIDVLRAKFTKYSCGHTIREKLIEKTPTSHIDIITSMNGHKAFKYQAETVLFLERAGFRAMVNHEMGVGKTVIANLVYEIHKEILSPTLVVCPAGLTVQWWQHILRWNKKFAHVLTTKDHTPDFKMHDIFIVSVDTLHRLPWMAMISAHESHNIRAEIFRQTGECATYADVENKVDLPEYREIRNKFNFIIIDEVQKVSNPTAQRTQAVKKLAAGKRVLTLSGTPIKNNPKEYFTGLNLVRPDLFPTETGYQRRFIKFDYYGKCIGMRNYEAFQDMTKDWIIRYERKDVLPDLPLIFRQFNSAEMTDKDDIKAYSNELDDFLEFMDDHNDGISAIDITNVLAYFARMRHITGISKIKPTVEYVEQFLLETNRKITLFVHHKDVMEGLVMRLNKTCKDAGYSEVLTITSAKDAKERMNVIEDFKKPENRILIASTLAAGEGINLQMCSDCIIVERQWNPANEEQAEARFPRPGNEAESINAVYMIVPGTIDDFLTELVEKKRSMLAQALSGEEVKWDESSLMRDLMDALRDRGKSKWKAAFSA